jgi:hypothetical protein
LGLVVVGGLVVSQSLTLFITPVIYLYLEWARTSFAKFLSADPVPAEAHAGAQVASQPGE